MLEAVTAYIERHHLFPTSGEVIVAVSGGADSLCLLHLLHQLCGPSKSYPALQLQVAHLDHQLRGEASARDASWVAQLVTTWGLPVTIGERDVPALARNEGRSLEDAARTARYRFLREVAHGRPIAVAHHADDQVETLLLHWLRGSGLPGMVGMLPRQNDIIRPLLAVNHAQILAYCQQQQLVPLQDASNSDPRFLRNCIRHELLPLLETMQPGIRDTLLRNAEVLRADAQWIEAQVDSLWPAVVNAQQDERIKLHKNSLQTLPLSLQRHLLRRVTALLCEGQSPLELRHYLLIEELLERKNNGQGHVALDLPFHIQVTSDLSNLVFERLHSKIQKSIFSAADFEMLLPIPGCIEVQGTPWIASTEIVDDELSREVRDALCRDDWPGVWRLLPSTRHRVYIDGDAVGHVGQGEKNSGSSAFLLVRTRRTGDRIQPLGMTHEKKVQDVLVNKHISRVERVHLPLFFSLSHCVWLAGVQLDHRVRLTCETQKIVRLSISQK